MRDWLIRIPGADCGCRYTPRAKNLALMPLFDWNIEARFQVPIDGGKGIAT